MLEVPKHNWTTFSFEEVFLTLYVTLWKQTIFLAFIYWHFYCENWKFSIRSYGKLPSSITSYWLNLLTFKPFHTSSVGHPYRGWLRIVTDKSLWPWATSNYGDLRPRIGSLVTQECCGLRPQQTVAAYGFKIPYVFREMVINQGWYHYTATAVRCCNILLLLSILATPHTYEIHILYPNSHIPKPNWLHLFLTKLYSAIKKLSLLLYCWVNKLR